IQQSHSWGTFGGRTHFFTRASGGEEGPPTRTNRLAAVSDVRQRRGARPRRSNYGLYAHMVVNRGVLFPRA
ncbi:hypothetical protein BHM03_00055271, partial [Ensete ventricosum]